MRAPYPNIFFGLVVCTALAVCYFGIESYRRLVELQETVELQRGRNSEQRAHVGALEQEVVGLQTDERVLERAARNELGMSRPNEVVVLFSEQR